MPYSPHYKILRKTRKIIEKFFVKIACHFFSFSYTLSQMRATRLEIMRVERVWVFFKTISLGRDTQRSGGILSKIYKSVFNS